MGGMLPYSRGGNPKPMSSSRRLALLLALGLAAVTAALAQSSSSSSTPEASAPPADQAQAQAPAQSQGQTSVQARIRARRAQRRAAAIHEAYAHTYEANLGFGYLRFNPGPGLPALETTKPLGSELAHEYAWDTGFTRYFGERLGATLEARGYYATAYVGSINNPSRNTITNAAIEEYTGLIGPTYRFYMQPKFSVSGRVLGGIMHGYFSGDLGTATPASFGLWPNGNTFAFSVSVPWEYNLTPSIGLRVAPEYFFSGFGSTIQSTRGFTTGMVYRFGKQ